MHFARHWMNEDRVRKDSVKTFEMKLVRAWRTLNEMKRKHQNTKCISMNCMEK